MVETSNGAGDSQDSLVGRVRDAIRTAGINHSEVARNIGIEPSKLSKSLAGTRNFRVEEISQIASLTNVSTDWLTTGRSVQPPRRRTIPHFHHDQGDEAAGTHAGTREPAGAGDSSASLDDSEPLPDPAERPAGEWLSKGKRNQRRITAAAWELYADLGVDNVRTEDVAQASGLSTSAVNYHFRSKSQLLQATLRYTLDVLSGIRGMTDPDDPLITLREFARVHAGVNDKIRRVWSIWVQSWARAAVDEHARATLTDVYAEWFEMFASVVLAGQRAGTIRAGDTILMAKGLSVFIDGLGVARSTGQMSITDAEALQMLDDYLSEHIVATAPDHVVAAQDSRSTRTSDRPIPHPQEEGT
ncbi:TetR family transcriptional regulator C-terminal domain-containing protein [Brevibacterium sandarakinum]|uniref:TetR family transcriptional regulator C-terminal domain-containing protein n=1 Tax=Brevibacterium sandarakinum TaxID=629680 RepID=UPI001E56FD9C|nr:TetR family transcriptional regulator C-terminal domain-containing protein [Brevibacterium sandarakinum]